MAYQTRRFLLATGLAGFSQAHASPALSEPPPYVLPNSAVVPFVSSLNGVAYSLYVHAPSTYADDASGLRVIVTLDADYSFAICSSHLEHLADRDQAEQAIIVSVAYTGAYPDRRSYSLNRTRDYTPVFVAEGGYGPEFQAHSGGAAMFLRVIEEEIFPRIDAYYRTRPGARTLVGHSFGGLFGAYALETRPDLFDQYLLVSPSLWYADDWILARERERVAAPLARPTNVYLGVGALEQTGHDMVGVMTRYAAMLTARSDPHLQVTSRVFDDENHASIFPVAFSSGIRSFGTDR